MKKRILALAMTLVMCLSLLPVSALAAQSGESVEMPEATYTLSGRSTNNKTLPKYAWLESDGKTLKIAFDIDTSRGGKAMKYAKMQLSTDGDPLRSTSVTETFDTLKDSNGNEMSHRDTGFKWQIAEFDVSQIDFSLVLNVDFYISTEHQGGEGGNPQGHELDKVQVTVDGTLVPSVSYVYIGEVPVNAPEPPETAFPEVGASVTVARAPTCEGCTFSGWSTNDVEVTDGSFTMPQNNVVFIGSWETIEAPAASVTWIVDGKQVHKDTGVTGSAVSEYNYTAPAGYTFSGWYSDEDCTIEATIAETMQGDITYYGKTTANADTPYKVEHYQQGPDGKYPSTPTDTDNLTGTTGAIVAATPKIYTGFIYDSTAEGTVASGTISANGTLVLKLYYAIDHWKDADRTPDETDKDSETGGDGIPDKYQVLVLFKSADDNKGTVTGNGTVQVFTFTESSTSDDSSAKPVYKNSGDVTPVNENITKSAKSGYEFKDWTGSSDNETVKINSADPFAKISNVPGNTTITFVANWTAKSSTGGGGSSKPPVLNKEDHYAYIVGYPDGTVQPGGNITRAEVATIFFRMLTDDSRNEFWSQTNDYSDVSEGQWFNNAISTLSNAGIINGYEDGSFRPNAPITRAEFSKIAVSFFEYADKVASENPFSDVPENAWYTAFVLAAKEMGLIEGYPDGTFHPTANITRAEAVTIVNRTLERAPDADHFLKDMIVWPDNTADQWYYEAVQEATNSHEYVRKGAGTNKYEEWTKILEVRDWPALEKEWSDANSAAGGEVVK